MLYCHAAACSALEGVLVLVLLLTFYSISHSHYLNNVGIVACMAQMLGGFCFGRRSRRKPNLISEGRNKKNMLHMPKKKKKRCLHGEKNNCSPLSPNTSGGKYVSRRKKRNSLPNSIYACYIYKMGGPVTERKTSMAVTLGGKNSGLCHLLCNDMCIIYSLNHEEEKVTARREARQGRQAAWAHPIGQWHGHGGAAWRRQSACLLLSFFCYYHEKWCLSSGEEKNLKQGRRKWQAVALWDTCSCASTPGPYNFLWQESKTQMSYLLQKGKRRQGHGAGGGQGDNDVS